MFKIDFIVWKYFNLTPITKNRYMFKIDFIVWKYGNTIINVNTVDKV